MMQPSVTAVGKRGYVTKLIEFNRVLKDNGHLFIAIPFIYFMLVQGQHCRMESPPFDACLPK